MIWQLYSRKVEIDVDMLTLFLKFQIYLDKLFHGISPLFSKFRDLNRHFDINLVMEKEYFMRVPNTPS